MAEGSIAPHELNWFAMETKVRLLVQELMEPTIKRYFHLIFA